MRPVQSGHAVNRLDAGGRDINFLEHDALGGLSISMEGMMKRDHYVIEQAATAGVPIVTVFAGGYAKDFEDTVELHFNTIHALCQSTAPLAKIVNSRG